MLFIKKTGQKIVPVLLAILLCYAANITINQHYHQLSSGLRLLHAHPFHNNTNNVDPFQNHNHSSSELILLEQISTSVFLIGLFFLFLTSLLLISEFTTFPYIPGFKNPVLYFLKNYHAPPCQPY